MAADKEFKKEPFISKNSKLSEKIISLNYFEKKKKLIKKRFVRKIFFFLFSEK